MLIWSQQITGELNMKPITRMDLIQYKLSSNSYLREREKFVSVKLPILMFSKNKWTDGDGQIDLSSELMIIDIDHTMIHRLATVV